MTVSKEFIEKVKKILENQRAEILNINNTPTDIDMDGDETDEIQGNMLASITSQLSSRNSNKLNQINCALKKISDCTFGKCEDCDEDIPEQRLMINPYFLTCVSCAEEREAELKHRRI
jgi:DnaK suppressor protein